MNDEPMTPSDALCPRCGGSLIDTGGSEGPFLTCARETCEWSAGPFNTLVDLRAFVASMARPTPPAAGDVESGLPPTISHHLGWLKVYVQGATPENWRDMMDHAERQIDWLKRDLLAALSRPTTNDAQTQSLGGHVCGDDAGTCPMCMPEGAAQPARVDVEQEESNATTQQTEAEPATQAVHSEAGTSEAPEIVEKTTAFRVRKNPNRDPLWDEAEVIANSVAIRKDWSIGSQAWSFAREGAFAALKARTPPSRPEDAPEGGKR